MDCGRGRVPVAFRVYFWRPAALCGSWVLSAALDVLLWNSVSLCGILFPAVALCSFLWHPVSFCGTLFSSVTPCLSLCYSLLFYNTFISLSLLFSSSLWPLLLTVALSSPLWLPVPHSASLFDPFRGMVPPHNTDGARTACHSLSFTRMNLAQIMAPGAMHSLGG